MLAIPNLPGAYLGPKAHELVVPAQMLPCLVCPISLGPKLGTLNLEGAHVGMWYECLQLLGYKRPNNC